MAISIDHAKATEVLFSESEAAAAGNLPKVAAEWRDHLLKLGELCPHRKSSTTIPEFFINFLTEPGDVVVDPFAGSNTTGAVAERLDRKWIAMDLSEDYLEASKFRFDH